MEVLIAGAGIAGLAAAGLLAQAGATVRVFERSQELREVGAGIQISANAGHALDALGIGEEVRAAGLVPEVWKMRLHDTGEVVASMEIGARHTRLHGQPYLLIHRAALQRFLIDRLEELAPNALHLGTTVARVRPADGQIAVSLDDGREVEGDLLIAADGVKSALREHISGPDQPVYSGSAAWRGLVPIERLPSEMCASGPNSFLGHKRHMVQYRVRDADGQVYLNYVAPVEQPEPESESWSTRHDWAELKADFEGWHDEVQIAIDETEKDQCFLWTLNLRKPIRTWVRGRAALIGDAAHPTLPFIAQGAAMALEDAAVLCRSLREAGTVDDGLALYAASRVDRTARIVGAANTIAQTFHGAGDRDLRADLQSGASSLEARDTWLYNYNPMTVPLGAPPAQA